MSARSSGASRVMVPARMTITRLAPLLRAPLRLALLACMGVSAAVAQQVAPVPSTQAAAQQDSGVLAELESLQAKLEQVRDLSTRFVQEKHTPLLRKPLTSSGRIRIVGNLMRWDTQKPTESVMLIGEKEIRLYYPQQKLMEMYAMDQQLARMAASPVPRISVMKEHFDFARASLNEMVPGGDETKLLAVALTPKQETLKQHIQQVRLVIDRETGYLRQMEMVDADGDRTVIRFEDVLLNTGLSAKDLALEPQAGTRVSYPLSADGEK